MQAKQFFEKASEVLKSLDSDVQDERQTTVDDTSVAKLFEEVKAMFQDLPSRLEDRLSEAMGPSRRRRKRWLHPIMFDELMHMGGERDDPIWILMAASMVRDDMPWFYEIAVDAYRAIKSGNAKAATREIRRLRDIPRMMMHGPRMEEFMHGPEAEMVMMEFPRMFDPMMHKYMAGKEAPRRRPCPGIRTRPPVRRCWRPWGDR